MSRIEDSFINRWKGEPAEEQIKQLRKQYEDAPPVAKGAVTGGNKLARGGFSKSHFPLEFIQNADDEGANKIKFEIDEDEIRIADDGGGFDFEGIVSVCQQGRSPKDPEEQIGFMGIGFKSIFEVCDRVEVHTTDEDRSKEYQFYFDPSDEVDGIPGNLVPNHLEKSEARDEYDTVVIGDIEEGVDLLGDEGVMNEENLSPTVFLFLNELEEIRIEGARNGKEIDRTLKRNPSAEEDILEDFIAIRDEYIESEGFSGHPDGDISDDEYVNIRTIEEEDETSWLIFRDFWKVGEDTAAPAFRENVEVTDVFAAFRLDPEGQLLEIPEGGTVRISPVHSYLPLKQLDNLDIDFIIHADFDLTPNREGIRSDSEWNSEIADQVRECLETVLNIVAEHDEWWRKLHLLVPEAQSGTNDIIDGILEEFADHIQAEPVAHDFGDKSGSELYQPNSMTKVTDDVRRLFTSDEVEDVLGEQPIHPEQTELLDRLGETSEKDVVDMLKEDEVTQVLETKSDDINWVGDLYEALASIKENSPKGYQTRRVLANEIAITRDGKIVPAREGTGRSDSWIPYLSPESDFDTDLDWALESVDLIPSNALDRLYESEEADEEKPPTVRDFFEDAGAETAKAATVVSESLEEDKVDELNRSECMEIIDIYRGADASKLGEDIVNWLNRVSWESKRSAALRGFVKKCTEELTHEDCVGWVSDRWWRLTPEEKDATIEFCKRAYDEGVKRDERYAFLELRNQHNSLTDAKNLLLPDNTVLTPEDFRGGTEIYREAIGDIGFSFVNDSYYLDEERTDESWMKFLKTVGVNDDNKLNDLAGRIGEIFVREIAEEKLHKRLDAEGGADFETDDGSKLIEVKSTKSSRKTEVQIKSTQFEQFDKCRREGEDQEFIVYPVSNALEEPEIKDGPFDAHTLWDQRNKIEFDVSKIN